MKTLTLCALSFVAGILSIVLTRQWVTPSHVSAQIAGPKPPIVPALGSAIPRVDQLPTGLVQNFVSDIPVPALVTVDGLQIDKALWESSAGVTFRYGGGAYSLSNIRVSGPVQLELVGAAANTVLFLQQFGAIPLFDPVKPIFVTPPLAKPPIEPNTPIKRRINIPKEHPLRLDVAPSQYGRYP